jgi:hypothetical protein
MSRMRLILVSLLAVSALSAVTAASASAFSWWIETEKGGEEVLKEKVKEVFNPEATVHKALKIKFAEGRELVCEKARYEEGFIEGLVKLGAKAFKFEDCTVPKIPGCEIEGKEIKTSQLAGEIKQNGSAVEFALKATSGAFAKFKLLGICAATVEVTGTAQGEITNPKALTKEKSFLFQTKEGGLEVKEGESGKKKVESSEGEVGYSATKGWSAR